jgi:predicted ATPase
MIGRDRELQQLLDALYVVLQNHTKRMVTIVGEAGIGKSRLVYELSQWVERLPEPVQVWAARAEQRTHTMPYSLIRAVFTAAFDIHDNDPAPIARYKLEQGMADVLGESGYEHAHFLGQLIGLDFSASPFLSNSLIDAQQLRARSIEAVAQFLTATTRQSPLVIILEDLHWADEGTLDFIQDLSGVEPDAMLLVIGTTRHQLFERRLFWNRSTESSAVMNLGPLSDEASRGLVAASLRNVEQLPQGVRDLILSRAEGNPFYIEELIKMLIADGTIITDTAQWKIKSQRFAQLRVPPTLTELLHTRLDALSNDERSVLEYAAVVGRIFWQSTIAQLAHPHSVSESDQFEREPAIAVVATLDALERYELIATQNHTSFEGEHEYLFKHALLQELVYARMPLQKRQQAHAQVAAWLIAHSGERANESAGLIAEHYANARDISSACAWYERAAKLASDTYALEAAITYYRQALALLPDGTTYISQRLTYLDRMGETLAWHAQLREAATAYVDMRTTAERANDTLAQVRAWCGLAWVQDNQGDSRAALASARRADMLTASMRAPRERIIALIRKGWALARLGDGPAALATGQEALDIARSLNAFSEIARTLDLMGSAYELLELYDQSLQARYESLAIERALGNRRVESVVLNNLGVVANICGDYKTAVQLLEESLRIKELIGERMGRVFVLGNLGWARNGLGQYRAAEADLQHAVSLAEASGQTAFAYLTYGLAEACLGQGKTDEALILAQQSLNVAHQDGAARDVGIAWRVLGCAMACMADHIGAGSCFAESVRVLAEANLKSERARTLLAWAEYERSRNHIERFEALWREARSLFTQLKLTHELARMNSSEEGRGDREQGTGNRE